MESGEQKKGLGYILAAFSWWGVIPIYFKALSQVIPLEVLCHRILWAAPFCAVLLCFKGGWREFRAALARPRVVSTLACTSALVALNWYIFIWAVDAGHVLEASLGYFITPLVNVLLGMIFLKERLNRGQALAVLLALAGTLNLSIGFGSIPWISLSLAFTFGGYGILRKTVKIGSLGGLFFETMSLWPLALATVLFLEARGLTSFGHAGWGILFIMLAAGAVTALPLVWFTAGARRLPMHTIGICQYLAPSIQFTLAVAVYGEAFTSTHLVTFGLIWSGVAIFLWDSWAASRRSALSLGKDDG